MGGKPIPRPCPACRRTLYSRYSLRRHVQARHEVDDIAVERAAYGEAVPLTLAERAAAVARLKRLSARRAGEVLGLSQRTVQRYRSKEAA